MSRRTMAIWVFIAVTASFAAAADNKQIPAKLTAAEIADRNVQARGGLSAWRAVQALTMSGKMDAGGNNRPTLPIPGKKSGAGMPQPRPAEQIQLPFSMELKRPHKSRVEVVFKGQTAIQVFDGTNGWKLRPFLNRMEVEPYTADEMKTVAMQSELDGPIADYAAKGTALELVGMEKVEGHDAYNLKLTMKSGQVTHVWIDASTFLETKMDGAPRRLDGKDRPVEIYLRDYHPVNGLQISYVIETRVHDPGIPGAIMPSSMTEKIIIDKVEVNPPLSDSRFFKAQLEATASAKPTSVQTPTSASLAMR